jgi:Na+/H+ antiporter NhaD/arsenite permease-like protein
VPALFSLVVIFAVVWLQWHARISRTVLAATLDPPQVTLHPLDRNQTIKGAVAILALLVLFTTPLPREIGALIIAALLLANRKITSQTMIAAVDWPLLLLVSCLFAITGALNHSGVAAELLEFLTNHDLLPDSLALLTPFSVLMTRWPCCRASPAIFCSPAA